MRAFIGFGLMIWAFIAFPPLFFILLFVCALALMAPRD